MEHGLQGHINEDNLLGKEYLNRQKDRGLSWSGNSREDEKRLESRHILIFFT